MNTKIPVSVSTFVSSFFFLHKGLCAQRSTPTCSVRDGKEYDICSQEDYQLIHGVKKHKNTKNN